MISCLTDLKTIHKDIVINVAYVIMKLLRAVIENHMGNTILPADFVVFIIDSVRSKNMIFFKFSF